MTESHITFETNDGRELLLKGVHYDVQIDGLMAKTTIAQHYSNPYDTNIEAVYTFPLTADAVLLGIAIKINNRVLKGVIKERSEAEADYEEAIDDGNRAIMVEKSSDGIYTVNIANLLPEDKISVNIEYTQLMEWRQDQVKWSLPTTIAPKYGFASDLSLDDVTDPAISLLAENLFSFNMRVKGVLADSVINAPSHQIDIKRDEESTFITLQNEKDFMDKDIVFTFKTQKARNERSFSLVGKDFDGYAAIASFYPSFGKDLPRQPKSVTFVIDCSGSMSGISMDRARTALNKALHLFTEEDSFNIIRFGSHHESLFEHEVPASSKNLTIAKRMIRSLDANMGGTEMEQALQSAYDGHAVTKGKDGYLFLITDGQIYDHESVIKSAKKSEMAHYVVGVGYASDDPLLKKIAAETRGSYENIDPNEKMDDYILNLFKKIDTPKAIDIKIQWPQKPKLEHVPNVIFDGDTLYAYGLFDKTLSGEIGLAYTLDNGDRHTASVQIDQTSADGNEMPSVVSKLVIAKEIEALNAKRPQERYYREETGSEESKEIVALSTKYQLFSELTNYILVDEVAEDEKPDSLPEMYKVENMMVESKLPQGVEQKEVCYSMSAPMLNESHKIVFDDLPDIPYENSASLAKIFDKAGSLFNDTAEYIKERIQADNNDVPNNIDASDYEKHLKLLNDWYSLHHRLPRKKAELTLAGFDAEIVQLFSEKEFRKEIQSFVIQLYVECDDHNYLDLEFIEYIENKLFTKPGLADRVTNYMKELF
jgi:Ca-activated chloride channel family protein